MLEQKTKGNRNHPQLERFREQINPASYVSEYLRSTLEESVWRGYKFSADKIPSKVEWPIPIEEADAQLAYEWAHLMNKLRDRDPMLLQM